MLLGGCGTLYLLFVEPKMVVESMLPNNVQVVQLFFVQVVAVAGKEKIHDLYLLRLVFADRLD